MPKTLPQQALLLPSAVLAVAGLAIALLCCAIPASAQESCQTQYNGCMQGVTTGYNACVEYADNNLNPEALWEAWDPGSHGYQECIDSAQYVEQDAIANCYTT